MKAGWKTSEFWIVIGLTVAKALVPQIPDELVTLAGTYVIGRAAQKSATSYSKAKENAAEVTASATVAAAATPAPTVPENRTIDNP